MGMVTFKVYDAEFALPDGYAFKRALGRGAYGVVCAATAPSGETVAVKKIENAFARSVEAVRTLREVQLMRQLRHPNLVGLVELLPPPADGVWTDVYVVMPCMETDLGSIIASRQPLSFDHCRFFAFQMLRGLRYMHSAGVIHRDIKPQNLLVNGDCELRICDFNLSRERRPCMTEYVVTRWYRAPELVLGSDQYTAAVDVWAAGCIVAEMVIRKPLLPGKSYVDQLARIVRLLGKPADTACVENEAARAYVEGMQAARPVSLPAVLRQSRLTPLVAASLKFDPDERASAGDLLASELFDEIREGDDPVAEGPVETCSPHLRKWDVRAVMERMAAPDP